MSAAARIKSKHSRAPTHGEPKRRVLYAEDQTTTRVVTTALLERLGYDVVAVEDGELAVEQAKCSLFDVILLDIEMPIMDGVAAARAIRRDVPGAKGTPILALSAFLADSTEHSIWRDAFDSAVPKPANGNELGRALSAALKDRPQVVSDLPWAGFSKALPHGIRLLMARTAAQELNHLVLTIASCALAGDLDGEKTGRDRLTNIAANFAASGIVDLAVAASPDMLLEAIANWQDEQVDTGLAESLF